VTYQVQSNIQLAAKNKTLAERVKTLGKAELRAEELDITLQTAGRNRTELEELLQITKNQCEDWEYKWKKCEQDKIEAKSVILRLEEDLIATRKSLSDSKKQAEIASKDSEQTIFHLNQRQKELENQWTKRLDEAEIQLEEQTTVIREQSRKMSASAGTINSFEEEIRRLNKKVEEKSRDTDAYEQRIRELEQQLAQQERKNKSLVEALEREVRERAVALHRAKDSLSS
jgi:chromosome segregation ATPase